MHGFDDFVRFAIGSFAAAVAAVLALGLVAFGVSMTHGLMAGCVAGMGLYRLILWVSR